ncbi:MAG: 2-keto-4-pentenoate hydratase [Actinomycetes bacterium]
MTHEHAEPPGPPHPAALASVLQQARAERRTLAPLTDSYPLTMAEAYAVQAAGTALRLARGEHVVGWKLGYTSQVMRAQMGVAEPNFGPLTDAMLLGSGAVLRGSALQPRVEPEIGLRLGRRLSGAVSADEALAACSEAVACLEVVDSVWTGYRFRIEDNTADGSSAAWVVVGPALPMNDLAAVSVSLARNGAVCGSGTGADAGGHPAAGLAWLAARLAERGQAVEAGALVITGGLTAAVPLEPGDEVRGSFELPRAGVDPVDPVGTNPYAVCSVGRGWT